jgi:hypothetical protein
MINGEIGNVTVTTTTNCHLPPEHWAEQAMAFKVKVHKTIEYFIKEAIKEDRSRVVTLLRSAGHNDLANSVEKL